MDFRHKICVKIQKKYYLPITLMQKNIIYTVCVVVLIGLSYRTVRNFILEHYYFKHVRHEKKIDDHHVETTLFNGYKIVLNSDDRCVCWRVRREGIWGVHEVKVLEDILKPGMRVVEIGANYGTHTLHMSKLIGPTGQIIAFECNPFVSSKLKKSLEINKISNCILKEMAVSDHAYATFIVYDLDNIGGGYILSENHAKSFDPTAFKLHHKISVTTLDEELKDIHDIDLLKMDAEGAEYLILQGAEKFTQRHPNLKIMMEWG